MTRIRPLILAVVFAVSTVGTALGADQVFRFPFREPDYPIDPSKGATLFNAHYMNNLFEGLLEATPEGRVNPLGATRFEVSPDGKTYTFTLRPGVKWSDGRPVTAQDYEFAWKRALDPKTQNINVGSLFVLAGGAAYNRGQAADPGQVGVKAKSDTVLEITLESPAAWFVAAVASDTSFLPIPRHAVAQHGDKWTEAGNIVTNGPFTIESWRHDQQMTLAPNPQYWREKPAGKVVVSMTNDPESTSVTAYETDEVDFAWVPPTQLNQVRAHPALGKDLKSTTLIATWFTVFDTVTPPFNDARVRRAFAMSLDRQRLTQAFLQGAFRPATSLTPPGTLGHLSTLSAGGGVPEAKKLLAEAGYPDGKGFPEVTYTCSNLERERIVAQALQQMWKEALNVNVKIDILERRAYQTWRASRKEQPFHMHEGGWTAQFVDPWLFHNQMLSARVDRQNHKWKNSAYEDLIWKASAESNADRRRALYEQAEQIVAQEAPVIPWGYRLKPYLLKPYVQGLETEATGYVDLFRKVKIAK